MTPATRSVAWFGLVVLVAWAVLPKPGLAGDDSIVKWKRIEGNLMPAHIVGGFVGFPQLWTTTEGKAKVNLETGHVVFEVRGLTLASQPPATAPGQPVIGTPGLVTEVKGTLVCDATLGLPSPPPPFPFPPPPVPDDSFVDTPAVFLTERGRAHFEGTFAGSIPAACLDPTKLAFLLRVASAGNPNFVNTWLAFGAVRIIRD